MKIPASGDLCTAQPFQKLDVCFVQPVLSPYWQKRFRWLGQSQDINVSLLLEKSSFNHRPGWQVERIDGVDTHVIDSLVLNTSLRQSDLGYVVRGIRTIPFRLIAWLGRLRPDVVIVCNATQLLFSLPTKILFGHKLVLLVEDTLHSRRNMPWHRKLFKNLIYRLPDSWFAFSDDACRFLESIGVNEKVFRTSWSIDTSHFSPYSRSLVAPTRKKIVSCVAALVPGKGITWLLEAWARLPSSVKARHQLVIAGAGPQMDVIRQRIEASGDDVELLGQIGYSEVAALLGDSSLFVLPTLGDLCSLSVLEAMAAGCAVITTPYNGARDLIDVGENGWIVDPLDVKGFTDLLEKALSDHQKLEAMGLAARRRALSRDNQRVMQELAAQLVEIAGVRPR